LKCLGPKNINLKLLNFYHRHDQFVTVAEANDINIIMVW